MQRPGRLATLDQSCRLDRDAIGTVAQLILLFAFGGVVALLSAFVTTALYTRRFRLISDTLRQAEAGTYAARPTYASHDEVGASLDLIDRLVMKQRKNVARASTDAASWPSPRAH